MAAEQPLSGFIRSTFRSVWSLELLCLLRKHPDRDWPADELVGALRASELIVAQGVEALTVAGLVIVQADGSARYQPASPALDTLAGETEALYARSPDAVRRLIVSGSSSGLAAFSDAFRLWRD